MSKKFATLESMKKSAKEGGGESSDDDEKGQAFYVGGSEKSGQEVLGPPRKKKQEEGGEQEEDDDVTDKLFSAARRHGAEPVTNDGNDAASASASVRFHGSGYRLGDNVLPSARIDGGAAAGGGGGRGGAADAAADMEHTQAVTLLMWQDGFSIDDGPLRRFDDAANRPFLQSIMHGQIPAELMQLYPGTEIDLKMERRSQPYKAPKSKPFAGQGQRLGGLVPTIVSNDPAPIPPPQPAATAATQSGETADPAMAEAQQAVGVREGEPTTQLQLRLQSGQRLIAKFNQSHTVSDVRSFIVTARPELAFQPFVLMMTFPNKVVEDETQTLKAAGLLNAVLVIKPN